MEKNNKITLKIGGMTCASCAAVVEYGLKKKEGINSANVNLASEKAYIDFDQDVLKEKDTTINNVNKITDNLSNLIEKYKSL